MESNPEYAQIAQSRLKEPIPEPTAAPAVADDQNAPDEITPETADDAAAASVPSTPMAVTPRPKRKRVKAAPEAKAA